MDEDSSFVQVFTVPRDPRSGLTVGGFMVTSFNQAPDQVFFTAAFRRPDEEDNRELMLARLRGRVHTNLGRTLVTKRGKVRPRPDEKIVLSYNDLLDPAKRAGIVENVMAFLVDSFSIPVERHFLSGPFHLGQPFGLGVKALMVEIERALHTFIGQRKRMESQAAAEAASVAAAVSV